jgi:hypothetical protein
VEIARNKIKPKHEREIKNEKQKNPDDGLRIVNSCQ